MKGWSKEKRNAFKARRAARGSAAERIKAEVDAMGGPEAALRGQLEMQRRYALSLKAKIRADVNYLRDLVESEMLKPDAELNVRHRIAETRREFPDCFRNTDRRDSQRAMVRDDLSVHGVETADNRPTEPGKMEGPPGAAEGKADAGSSTTKVTFCNGCDGYKTCRKRAFGWVCRDCWKP